MTCDPFEREGDIVVKWADRVTVGQFAGSDSVRLGSRVSDGNSELT